LDGVGRRALTTVDNTRRISNVGLVIGGVKISTVPTGGEEDLDSETLRAVSLGESVGFR
jgi:hypothetical protein